MDFLIPKEEILWVRYTENDVVKYIITSNLYRTEYYLYKIVNNKPKKTKYTSNDPLDLEQYIKQVTAIEGMILHPSFMPESSDPEGSTRHSCFVIHIINRIEQTQIAHINYMDYIEEYGVFIVVENTHISIVNHKVKAHQGIVLKEKDGSYSWWFDLL